MRPATIALFVIPLLCWGSEALTQDNARKLGQGDGTAALLSRADDQVAAGRLTDPTGDNAMETYRQVLTVASDSREAAHRLLQQIRAGLVASARYSLRAGKSDAAQRFYELALQSDASDAAIAVVDSPRPVAARLPVEMLLQRGDELLSNGDISASRLLYERAASAGSARAMTALGKTYDPLYLDQAGVRGLRPDPTIAAAWYQKAAAMGDVEAASRMARLSAGPPGATASNIGQPAQSGSGQGAGSSSAPGTSNQSAMLPPARPQPPRPTAAPLPTDAIAMLLRRGDDLLSIGDISAARLVYERAALGGSARAMTALGKTYDPVYFNQTRVQGLKPDPAMAAEWYQEAAAMGDAEAASRMADLAAYTGR
jgi:TPR repeat protein